jgi:hypothetical protein
MGFDLAATALITLMLVVWLRERVLYVVFAWAYVQNFVLAWMYTSGWAGQDLCRALLISKELLLLWLFLYFLPRVSLCARGHWPLPLRILGLFAAWCTLRYAVAVALQGQSLFGNLWNLRLACFPFEILAVGVGVASVKPGFARRFIGHMVWLIAGLALVGILLYVLPGPGFWRDHVNIAAYDLDVKNQSPTGGYSGQAEAITAQMVGISGNGLARGAFSFLSSFRAFGTVGDAVGFGQFVAFPVLLLAFWLRRSWKTQLMLAVTAAALLFSFTRSAWIFVALGWLYVLLRKRRYRLVFGLGGMGALLLFVWGAMAGWALATLRALSWANPQNPHAEGIVWLYKEGLWQFSNLLGQGMVTEVPESGYGLLLIRFGLPAVVGFVWFCVALYKSLRKTPLRGKPLFLAAQSVPLCLLVIMNFSYYPFSFIPYLFVWFVVGTCLAASSALGPRSTDPRARLIADAVTT